jgi:hypothetical protein
VTLAKVFSAVDEGFIAEWVDRESPVDTDNRVRNNQSMSKFLKHACIDGTVSPSEVIEVQRLDIVVTQQWLRVLACQLHMRRNPPSSLNHDHDDQSRCVIDTSRTLLHTITTGSQESLEAHGIGMVRNNFL